ncbi:hypothetical protein [Hymenobacter cellulosivorans]|uniref:Uncharacterized protein n=1 Tax=Hymenobacter cellulosivorans TaxID=2932249 RepID=A0ABY4FE04_9BACT|nr:hypothetical protein [Hymenobacter cellulosivorans]UOQ54209.1 hypothetical protein MUN80_05475 [Hymenobacter cellulosivorans]
MLQTKLIWYDAPICPVPAAAAVEHFRLPALRPLGWVLVSLGWFWGPYANLMQHMTTAHRQHYAEAEL